jgi:hypothetical protein
MTYETLDWIGENVWVLTSTEHEDYGPDDVFWDTVCVPLFSDSTIAEQFAARRGLVHWIKPTLDYVHVAEILDVLQRQGAKTVIIDPNVKPSPNKSQAIPIPIKKAIDAF